MSNIQPINNLLLHMQQKVVDRFGVAIGDFSSDLNGDFGHPPASGVILSG